MFCPKCGFENNDYGRFCSKCGVALPANDSLLTQNEMQRRDEAEKKYRFEQMQMLKKVQAAKNWATASLIMGIFCIIIVLLPNIFGLLGVIFGIVAVAKMPKYGSKVYPAVALVISIIAFILNIFFGSAFLSGVKAGFEESFNNGDSLEEIIENFEGGKQLTAESGGEVYNLDF